MITHTPKAMGTYDDLVSEFLATKGLVSINAERVKSIVKEYIYQYIDDIKMRPSRFTQTHRVVFRSNNTFPARMMVCLPKDEDPVPNVGEIFLSKSEALTMYCILRKLETLELLARLFSSALQLPYTKSGIFFETEYFGFTVGDDVQAEEKQTLISDLLTGGIKKDEKEYNEWKKKNESNARNKTIRKKEGKES